jgi:hypothetical protein
MDFQNRVIANFVPRRGRKWAELLRLSGERHQKAGD